MTNGEKLCVDFPKIRYTISQHRVITTIGVAASFDLDWWNAEYKEPNKSEIPTDSTTKDDLAVAEMIRLVRESDVIDRTDGSVLAKAFNYLFDRYIEEPTTKTDLGVGCIDRQTTITFVCKNTKEILKDTMPLEVKLSDDYLYENVTKIMRNPKVLPSVTPQEPILEKIRAEINEHIEYNKKMNYMGIVSGLLLAKNVLDKYKAESEG